MVDVAIKPLAPAESVTAPGFYRMTAAQYHADPCPEPSLSSSVAKVLIAKSPRHARCLHPRLYAVEEKNSTAMDIGSVVHELVLGKGTGFAVLEYPDYKTKAVQAERDAARAAGKTPVLMHQLDTADVIAEAVRRDLDHTRKAAHIFAAGKGDAEIVAIWQEDDGTWCRAMLDWWSTDRTEIADLKTSGVSIAPADVGRLVSNMGYEISEAFYTRGVLRLVPELAGRLKFRFVFVETEAPWETVVIENDATAREMGRRKVCYAIQRWGACLRTDVWPGYPREILRAEHPPYAESAWLKREVEDPSFEGVVL